MRGWTLAAALVSVGVVSASPADASILFDLSPVDNSAVLTGYVTYDLQVTSEYDWTAAAGLLELSAGSIYQHEFGADTGPPHPDFITLFPELEFDTYVVGNTAGGGGDVGGTGYAFNGGRLDVSWFNITDTDIGTTTIGRLTLTDDAAGSLSILLITADKDKAEFDVAIAPGASPLVSQMIEEPEASGFGEIDWGGSTYEPSGDIDRSAYYVTPGELFQRRLESWDMYPSRQPRNIVLSDSGNYFVSLSDPGGFFTSQPEPVDTTSDSGVPEPASLLLITTCLGMIFLRRRFPQDDA